MSQNNIGEFIQQSRKAKGFTQKDLGDRIGVSDKTISKWETAKGYPDISLLEPLAAALDISVAELLSGDYVTNQNKMGNMLRSVFYICPVCGNIMPRDKNAAINILEEGLRTIKENMIRPSVEGYNKPSLITTIV